MSLEGFEWKPLEEIWDLTPDFHAADAVKDKFPGFSGLWCRFMITACAMTYMHDVVLIVHGPLGCTSELMLYFEPNVILHYGLAFPHIISTNMDKSQVVMGGEENLAKVIREVDRDFNPPLIFVLTNCCPELIGDDVEQIVEDAQADVKAKVIFIPSAGFTSCWDGYSVEWAMINLTKKIMEPPKKVDPLAVNILGLNKEIYCTGRAQGHPFKFPTNADELGRYITALGLKVHRVLQGGDYEYNRTAPKAAVNTIDCPTWGYPMAQQMEKAFGTPYLKHCLPLDLDTTRKWIMDLARFMGRDEEGERFILEEERKITGLLDKTREIAEGKVALIEGGRHVMTALARSAAQYRFAESLGMKGYIFNLHPLEVKAKPYDVEYFLSSGCNPPILFGPYDHERPLRATDVMAILGIDEDQGVYFTNDIFPLDVAGKFDPSNVARLDTAVHMRRHSGAPQRGTGFRGIAAMCDDLISAIKAAKRVKKPTMWGRLYEIKIRGHHTYFSKMEKV